MLLRTGCLLAAFALLTSAQPGQMLESGDFNLTQALLDHDIDVSKLPAGQLRRRSSAAACSIACSSLEIVYGPDRVIFKSDAAYNSFTGGYWSKIQSSVSPYCIFKAPDKTAISVVVLLSRLTSCPFAAKSGGHAAFKGASNIDGGITISLESLNSIRLSKDKKTVAVGPGNSWAEVYTELAKSDLAVIGGRVSSIGVGGLTLGGGISFFSSLYGWACDNVASYDVVLANGVNVAATPSRNSDLFWALRGGGNNFGLVVNFDYETIPLPDNELWGGNRIYSEDQFNALTKAFAAVVTNSPRDGNAGQWIAWVQINGSKIASTELWYGKADGQDAAIFDEYNALDAVSDNTQNRKLAAYTIELEAFNPSGLRETYYGLTVKADQEVADMAKDIFYEELPATAAVSGVNPVLLYQGITEPQIKAMQKKGGNPLGISPADGPLYLIQIACWWEDEADDETIYTFITKVLTRLKAEAGRRGRGNDYVYMNYASLYQDVIRSYGADNKARLKAIASRYDPRHVFQTLQPGYFKLDRAPVLDPRYFSG